LTFSAKAKLNVALAPTSIGLPRITGAWRNVMVALPFAGSDGTPALCAVIDEQKDDAPTRTRLKETFQSSCQRDHSHLKV
jgi:hypothetical protein